MSNIGEPLYGLSDLFADAPRAGIPTKLLHESLGHVITVELKTGQTYRGKLFDGARHLYRPLSSC